MMLILLLCTFGLTSAINSDLRTLVDRLGCSPNNPIQMPKIAPENTVAKKLSEYCSSYEEIAYCIKEGDSSNPIVRYMANHFDKAAMIGKSHDLCNRIQNDNLASNLNCLEDADDISLCFYTLMNSLESNINSDRIDNDVCMSMESFMNCERQGIAPICSSEAKSFMVDYVTVLTGSLDTCQTYHAQDMGPYSIPDSVFQWSGSALEVCTISLIKQVAIIHKQLLQNNLEKKLLLNDFICGVREKILPCLKNKMPSSNSPFDQFILLFVDLDRVENSLNNLCKKLNVITNNFECMSRNTSIMEWMSCFDSINNDIQYLSSQLGFGVVDYICSTYVNVTECAARKATEICSSEIGDLIMSSFKGLLTTQCLEAKPRSVVGPLHPGWSYSIVPGGMVILECISQTALDIIDFLHHNANRDNKQVMIKKMVEIICMHADATIDCMEQNLPGGTSRIDGLTREIIDLKKLRQNVASLCSKQNELVSLVPCLSDEKRLIDQGACAKTVGDKFLEKTINPTLASLLIPATMETIKGLVCGDDSALKIWVKCEVNAIKDCSPDLAIYVPKISTGIINDKCGKNVTSCNGPKCGASSVVVHEIAWLLVGIVTLISM